jgi:hypothetical protein
LTSVLGETQERLEDEPGRRRVTSVRTAGTITRNATGTVRKKRARVLNARKISTARGMAQRLAILALNITQAVA